MTNYEVMFILKPTVEEGKVETLIETVKEIISADGSVDKADSWGIKKLAYPIEKFNEGFYVLIEFKSGVEVPKELNRRLKIMDEVIRHMIINKDEK